MANLSNINNKFLVTTGGNVLIGATADVSGKLQITGTARIAANASYYSDRTYLGDTWEFASDTTDGVTFKITGGDATTTGNYFRFQTQSGGATADTKLIIDKSGNVGIGATSIYPQGNNTILKLYSTSVPRFYLQNTTTGSNTTDGSQIYVNGSDLYITNSESANTIFSTNSLPRMRIDSSGNVGIGIDTPQTLLNVNSLSGTTYPTLGTASGVIALSINELHGMYLGVDGASGNGWIQSMREDTGATAYNLILQPSGGNVGIGQTGPGQKLVIGNYDSVANGTMRITALGGQGVGTIRNSLEFSLSSEFSVNSSDAYKFSVGLNSAVGNSGNYNSDFVIRRTTRLGVTDNVDFMIDGTSGNIGIGVTNPQMGLHVADTKGALFGPSGSGTASAYFSPSDENTLNGSYGIDTDGGDLWLNYRGYQDGFTRFRDTRIGNGKGGVVALFEGSTGYVGIGTTTPSQKLEVAGNINVINSNPYIWIGESGSGGGAGFIGWNDAGDYLFLGHSYGSAFNKNIVINSSGNVGIGTAGPDSKIQVEARNASNVIYAGFRVGYNATSNNYYDADTHHFRLGTGSSAGGNLYVGGGVYLGGTATANKLDDYDEGTWTPAVSGSGTAGTATYGLQGGSYTKIGNKVTCWFSIANFAQSGASGNFIISGLPFTCITTSSVRGCFSSNLRFYNMPFAGDVPVISLDQNSTAFAILWSRNNTTWVAQSVSNSGGQYIEGYVTYSTA